MAHDTPVNIELICEGLGLLVASTWDDWAPQAENNMKVYLTINYRVTVENRIRDSVQFTLNDAPTIESIVAVLKIFESDVVGDPVQWVKKYENLTTVAQLATDLKIPMGGWFEKTVVTVAGVDVGSIGIRAEEAWSVE